MNNRSSKMISVTPKAIARLENLINNSKAKAIKIGVENGGCAGMAYTMDYVTDLDSEGEIIEINDITIVIDNSAILFLLGTELDYEETKINSGFVFNNPNQTDACGCGESVTLQKADVPVEFISK
tara:strand:+ start:422 stop:796 length:375 start_codon:yes stop_codon:yes gene_type:complete